MREPPRWEKDADVLLPGFSEDLPLAEPHCLDQGPIKERRITLPRWLGRNQPKVQASINYLQWQEVSRSSQRSRLCGLEQQWPNLHERFAGDERRQERSCGNSKVSLLPVTEGGHHWLFLRSPLLQSLRAGAPPTAKPSLQEQHKHEPVSTKQEEGDSSILHHAFDVQLI